VLQAIPPLHLPAQTAPACSHAETAEVAWISYEVLCATNVEGVSTPTPGITSC